MCIRDSGYTVDEVNKLIDSFKSDKPKAIIDTSESFFINLLVKVY